MNDMYLLLLTRYGLAQAQHASVPGEALLIHGGEGLPLDRVLWDICAFDYMLCRLRLLSKYHVVRLAAESTELVVTSPPYHQAVTRRTSTARAPARLAISARVGGYLHRPLLVRARLTLRDIRVWHFAQFL